MLFFFCKSIFYCLCNRNYRLLIISTDNIRESVPEEFLKGVDTVLVGQKLCKKLQWSHTIVIRRLKLMYLCVCLRILLIIFQGCFVLLWFIFYY